MLDYRPGAGGTIASQQLARARPDGNTLIVVLAAHATTPASIPAAVRHAQGFRAGVAGGQACR
ncbi:tripartite tricarboxylate transporter substrate-binding protein [Cupriavidus basilensis]